VACCRHFCVSRAGHSHGQCLGPISRPTTAMEDMLSDFMRSVKTDSHSTYVSTFLNVPPRLGPEHTGDGLLSKKERRARSDHSHGSSALAKEERWSSHVLLFRFQLRKRVMGNLALLFPAQRTLETWLEVRTLFRRLAGEERNS
jgi:hypothetical protein